MSDYKDTNLDTFGFPIDSPITTADQYSVTAYDFNSNNDKNAVTSYFIKNLTADKITSGTISSNVIYAGTLSAGQLNGGTLTLGGTLNGNGLIQIKDTNGTSILQIDNTGVSLINGTALVDSYGLNSLNNFISDTKFSGTNINITSGTYASISGATVTPFVLSRNTRVLTYLRIKGWHSGWWNSGNRLYVRLVDDFDSDPTDGITTAGEHTIDVDWDTGTGLINSTTRHASSEEVVSISNDSYAAGTHGLYLQAYSDGTPGTATIFEYQIGYVLLGK